MSPKHYARIVEQLANLVKQKPAPANQAQIRLGSQVAGPRDLPDRIHDVLGGTAHLIHLFRLRRRSVPLYLGAFEAMTLECCCQSIHLMSCES